jgi:hypothetical protein
MASGPLDVTLLNLLVVVPVFGLVLWVPWSELWRKPVERKRRPLNRKAEAEDKDQCNFNDWS